MTRATHVLRKENIIVVDSQNTGEVASCLTQNYKVRAISLRIGDDVTNNTGVYNNQKYNFKYKPEDISITLYCPE